jgi:hypothetical protein
MPNEACSAEVALAALAEPGISIAPDRLRALWAVWSARRAQVLADTPLQKWLPSTPEELRSECEGPFRVCWEIARREDLPEDALVLAAEALPYLVATENPQVPLWAVSSPQAFGRLVAAALQEASLPGPVARFSTPDALRAALVDAPLASAATGSRAVLFYAACVFRRGMADPQLAAHELGRGGRIWQMVRAVCPVGESHPWFQVDVDRSCFRDPVLRPPLFVDPGIRGRLCGWGGT